MAIASTPTLLSLDRFAHLAQVHPLHFNQVYLEYIAPTVECSMAVLQHGWQMNDGVSRESIAIAIQAAENQITDFLGYPPAPMFFDEIVKRAPSIRPEVIPLFDLFNLKYGMFLSGGTRGTDLLDSPAITYTDTDGDEYAEEAIVTITDDSTLLDEIGIFYPGESDEEWRIRPVRVTRSGNTVTIKFRREQCVKPELLEAVNADPVDGTDDDKFLETVDVVRVYVDQSVQAQMFYYSGCSTCGSNGCNICTYAEIEGCITPISNRLGQVTVQAGTYADNAWSTAEHYTCGPFAKARLRYMAGLPLTNGRMDSRVEQAIAWLAMTKLDRPMCSCDSVTSIFAYWTRDLAEAIASGGTSNAWQLSKATLDGPFGTTRGAVEAYRLLKGLAL